MQSKCYLKRDVLKFKHFCHKGYALFACVGRVVVIGVLSIATLQNAKANGVVIGSINIEDDTIPSNREYGLEEIEVSGTRAPLSSGQAARMVTVLQSDDIQAAAVHSINDLLKLCTGVDVRQRAPMGAQTDISIRGGTSEHIAILLNGIRISDPQTGHNTLDLPIHLSEILRIEVLEGPAARAYGAQSLLGAINIVTREFENPGSRTSEHPDIRILGNPDSRPSEASFSSGSFGTFCTSGVALLPEIGGISNSLSASYSRSDGFSRDKNGGLNSDYEGNKLYYQGSLRPAAKRQSATNNRQSAIVSSLNWSFGLAKKRWGSSTSYGLGSDSQYEQTDKYFANISGNIMPCRGLSIKPAVYWQQNNDKYQWRRGISAPNRNTTNIYGANLNAIIDWTKSHSNSPNGADFFNKTALGIELRNEDLISSNMPNTNRTNLSLHFEHNLIYRRLSISAGFMALKNSFNGMPMKVYPGVDAACFLARDWKLYASWNKSMRLPSYTDLYYKVDGHLADPHLKPEEMEAFEAGIKYASPFGQSSLSHYRHQGKDMIDWILDTRQGKNAVWTSVNHARLNSYGIEFQSKWDLGKLLPSQKFLKTISFGYNYIHQKQQKEEFIQSLYALEYLRNKITARLITNLYQGKHSGQKETHASCCKGEKCSRSVRSLDLSVYYRFQDRIGEYSDAAGKKHGYAPYSIIDARLDWSTKRYSIFLSVNNLLSKRYVDYGNLRQPGAWFMGGITIYK